MIMTSTKAPIVLGSDHAAYPLKEEIKSFMEKKDLLVEDVGAHGPDSVDYPDFAVKIATMISSGQRDRGILLCGTGIGMSMVANRFSNVRAALCGDIYSAAMSRQHNNANILVLGARVIGPGLALDIVKTWLETPFDGGRHQLRIDKFNTLGKTG